MRLTLPILLTLACFQSLTAADTPLYGRFEAAFTSAKDYGNPNKDLQVRVHFSGPGGTEEDTLAFWDGGRAWKVRYQPEQKGSYRWTVDPSDKSNAGFASNSGQFVVGDALKGNPLQQYGTPRLSFDRHSLAQVRDRHWFWLADTAWNGALLSTKDEWERYLSDRANKRFTAVRFVMTQWRAATGDERGQQAYRTGAKGLEINPQFFQRMDEKVESINQHGMVAIPVLLWALGETSPGIALPTEQAAELARYMVSRYGAHHTIFCLGGDGAYSGQQAERWKTIGREVFPAGRRRQLVGMHPRGMQDPWQLFRQEKWLDLFLYQSGHGDDAAKWRWQVTSGPALDWRIEPFHPVIDDEISYEGHLAYQSKKRIDDFAVRRAAYTSLLAGAPAGVTYGAHGIWAWSRKAEAPMAHASTGATQPWTECLNYPGAQQMKILRDTFESIEWWRLQPDRYAVLKNEIDQQTYSNVIMFAWALRGDVGMMYVPGQRKLTLNLAKFQGDVTGTWVNPRTGEKTKAGDFHQEEALQLTTPGEGDWVMLLQTRNSK